ncbi:MAG: type II secretion system protein, partial [Campylobacteraceae bacterium]|nr:type II secretion system protein [Campylobacteraceae bacterium]
MIELIFVIVILGILASVAIPRLAGTREDAEISAAVANLRTLVSDASAYYTVKSGFGTGDSGTKWNEFTSVPLNNPNGTANGSDGVIKIGGKECIRVQVKDRSDNVPAHILVAKDGTNKNSGACKQVVAAEPLKAYFDSRVAGVEGLGADKGAIPIGSSTSIYGP